jgi:hypothetical protein
MSKSTKPAAKSAKASSGSFSTAFAFAIVPIVLVCGYLVYTLYLGDGQWFADSRKSSLISESANTAKGSARPAATR